MMKITAGLFLALSFFSHHLLAQENNTALQRASYFDVDQLQKVTPTLDIIPFFTTDNNGFWYSVKSIQDNRTNYFYVDILRTKKYLINNIEAIAALLKKESKQDIDPTAIRFDLPGRQGKDLAIFQYKNQTYRYDFIKNQLFPFTKDTSRPPYRPVGQSSPNGQWVLYSDQGNLYIQNVQDSLQKKQLTTDSESHYAFHSHQDGMLPYGIAVPTAFWYGGSRLFYAFRKDLRSVGSLSLVKSLTQPRPSLNTYKYELAGESSPHIEELFVGDVQTNTFFKVDVDKWPGQTLSIAKVDEASDKIYFTRKNRTCDEIELCKVDIRTGKVQVLIHEVSKPFINEDLFNVHVLNDGTLLWWSDRSGSGTYYRYDSHGKLLTRWGEGNWTAGKIVHIDLAKQQAYFYGYGRESAVNPYYAMLYKIDLNGKNLTLLTPENADHKVFLSPDKNYFLDTYSRIDQEPVSILRAINGKRKMEVYTPDLTALYAYGWKKPELFQVKAQDDSTILYGIMWKPFDFVPEKKYPIISQVYPGPQIETVWSSFTVFDRYNNTSLSNAGFIVVCMGHRGGSPYREASYYKFGHGNLRDYALDDDKYGIQQLASQHSFIDSSRVGITGHSGGGMMAVAALGKFPDFYKAAVASAGNHDNRIYNRVWGETYHGLQTEKDSAGNITNFRFNTATNLELAPKIKGALLLVAGETDANVHPAATIRMADAMIKAGKDFEMLLLPGQGHTYEGIYKKYYQRKQWQFFLKHLY